MVSAHVLLRYKIGFKFVLFRLQFSLVLNSANAYY